jgi:hypothetical protein
MSNCRICKRELVDGVGRYADHLLYIEEGIDEPICSRCAELSPDNHFREFKRRVS